MARASQLGSHFPEGFVILLLLTFVMWDPLRALGSDLLLRVGGVYVRGEIISAEEDVEDGPTGEAVWFHSAVYTFQTLDGQEFYGTAKGSGRLRSDLQDFDTPVPVVVEYLPRYPAVNRPRDSRLPQSWIGLTLRAAIGLAFVALWLVAIVIGIRMAIQMICHRDVEA